MEQLGINRRQALIKCSEWWPGQGSRHREEMLASRPWCLTVIGVDSPDLEVVEAGRVDSDVSSQWLSAPGKLLPATPWVWGEGGMFPRDKWVSDILGWSTILF